jgi:hypothetical protein
MASEKKTSSSADRVRVRSAEELETYGVWVKSEPQDMVSQAANAVDFGGDAVPFDADFASGIPGADPDDIPLDSPDPFDLAGMPDLDSPEAFEPTGFQNDFSTGTFVDSFGPSGEASPSSDNMGSFGTSEGDGLDDPLGKAEFDGPNADRETAEEVPSQLIQKMNEELTSLKSELDTLKQEFAEIRETARDAVHEPPVEADDDDGGFFSADGDSKVAFTQDEMKNILVSSDVSSGNALDGNDAFYDSIREEDEAALRELSWQTEENREGSQEISAENSETGFNLDRFDRTNSDAVFNSDDDDLFSSGIETDTEGDSPDSGKENDIFQAFADELPSGDSLDETDDLMQPRLNEADRLEIPQEDSEYIENDPFGIQLPENESADPFGTADDAGSLGYSFGGADDFEELLREDKTVDFPKAEHHAEEFSQVEDASRFDDKTEELSQIEDDGINEDVDLPAWLIHESELNKVYEETDTTVTDKVSSITEPSESGTFQEDDFPSLEEELALDSLQDEPADAPADFTEDGSGSLLGDDLYDENTLSIDEMLRDDEIHDGEDAVLADAELNADGGTDGEASGGPEPSIDDMLADESTFSSEDVALEDADSLLGTLPSALPEPPSGVSESSMDGLLEDSFFSVDDETFTSSMFASEPSADGALLKDDDDTLMNGDDVPPSLAEMLEGADFTDDKESADTKEFADLPESVESAEPFEFGQEALQDDRLSDDYDLPTVDDILKGDNFSEKAESRGEDTKRQKTEMAEKEELSKTEAGAASDDKVTNNAETLGSRTAGNGKTDSINDEVLEDELPVDEDMPLVLDDDISDDLSMENMLLDDEDPPMDVLDIEDDIPAEEELIIDDADAVIDTTLPGEFDTPAADDDSGSTEDPISVPDMPSAETELEKLPLAAENPEGETPADSGQPPAAEAVADDESAGFDALNVDDISFDEDVDLPDEVPGDLIGEEADGISFGDIDNFKEDDGFKEDEGSDEAVPFDEHDDSEIDDPVSEDPDLVREIPEARLNAEGDMAPIDDDSETGQEGEAASPTGQGAGDDGISPALKKDIKDVLSYMDQLLESLPEEKIEEFAKSDHFDTYKKLFKELGLIQ